MMLDMIEFEGIGKHDLDIVYSKDSRTRAFYTISNNIDISFVIENQKFYFCDYEDEYGYWRGFAIPLVTFERIK